jgi:uncharacterized protein YchJ
MNDQPTSATEVQELLRRGYTAFNARDIDTILSMMHPDVQWANGMEGGYVLGTTACARTGRISGVSSTRLLNPKPS